MDSLLLKGKAGCFPNWHEVQSKLSLDIEPNKLLEAVVPKKRVHDQDENAKVREKVRKKLQQL